MISMDQGPRTGERGGEIRSKEARGWISSIYSWDVDPIGGEQQTNETRGTTTTSHDERRREDEPERRGDLRLEIRSF